jgi:Fe(3+) dicitrate transport protein
MNRFIFDLPLARLVAALAVSFAFSVSLHAQDAASTTTTRIEVIAEPVATPHPHDDTRPKLEHIMREVDGTQITVTKKATVIPLDKQPPIQNNNLQEQFTKAPGLIVSEQQTPGQYNFTYRGLGNPQESEYTLFLQDGIPLMSDWIGFPTLYYLPVPQSVSEIQVIRGGSSLLYGPEPAPAINFVTKHPSPGTPWHAYLEGVGGPDNTFSTFGSVEEASGPVEFRMNGFYRTSDTQREFNSYDLWQADGYLGWRPTTNQLLALDVHAYRYDGEDAGRLNFAQWTADPDRAVTPYNHNWVDRYTVVLRYDVEFGPWLVQAKGWYTHQDIDSRTAGNLGGLTLANPFGSTFPTSTTFGYEEFNNGAVDLRARVKWGEGTMFRGSALTFGGMVYHGDAPFQRYTLQNTKIGAVDPNFGPNFLYAPRGSRANTIRNGVDVGPTLDQDRTADYQAFFIENVFRLGKFHIVPSFRLDHESVDVDATSAPYFTPGAAGVRGVSDRSADKLIPLWGIGLGNDFAGNNETYFSASSGWRPVRFFDIAGTRTAILPGDTPDPFRSLDIELGVHGTPFKGFWYDVGLFWMEFENRIESQGIPGNNLDTIAVNTGNTRHRGFEGEVAYDFLAPFQHEIAPAATTTAKDAKSSKDVTVEPSTPPLQFIVFGNLQLLDAQFTESGQTFLVNGVPHSFVGNDPAYAPDIVFKGGITFKRDKCFNVTFSVVRVSDQFWQDSNQQGSFNPATAAVTGIIPAEIPSYTIYNLSAEFYLTKNVRLFGGISNLSDEKYYSRVFPFGGGSIDPAPGRSGHLGLSVEF